MSDGTVQLAVDGQEMNDSFETLGHAVAEGAAVTILGGLVGTRTDEKEERKGCALLSLSIKGGHEGMGLKKGCGPCRGSSGGIGGLSWLSRGR